jgi:cbb3-type cytochrome oxidase maturation protein
MNVILILIIVSLGIALFFLAGFIWATRSGQFDDTCTPSMRVLTEEDIQPKPLSNSTKSTKTS